MEVTPSTPPPPIHILIVEDSPTQAEHLRYLLEAKAYVVTWAQTGKKALEMMETLSPDLIISDIVMPGMSGYELCRTIKGRSDRMDVPVILLTSLANPEDVLEGLASGADNFITKPFNEDYLISHIDQILANRKIRRNERVRVGVEMVFAGKPRFITADQQQMLTLLLSTYEAAVQKNSELTETQRELRELNGRLEELVAERTADLSNEIAIRKNTESALRESQTRLQRAEELGHLGHWRLDLKEDLWTWSDEVYRLHGVRAGEFSPTWENIADLMPTSEVEIFRNVMKTIAVQGTGTFEGSIIRPDGSRRHVQGTGEAILDENGRPCALFGTIQDVTEQRRNAARLEHLNRVLRSIREVNQLIVREKDPQRLIQEACDILVDHRGYISAQIILLEAGNTFRFAAQGGLSKRFQEVLASLREGQTLNCCLAAAQSDGVTLFSGHAPTCPLFEEHSQNRVMCLGIRHQERLFGYFTVALDPTIEPDEEEQSLFLEVAGDIGFALFVAEQETARVEAEAKRKVMEAQLQQAQKMEAYGRLAGGIAHDFNNLLGVILGSGELAEEDLSPDHPAFPRVKAILEVSQRAINLTRQLLVFSRKDVLQPKVVNLNEVVQDMEKILHRIIGEDIVFKTECRPDLKNVMADSGRLGQVIMNLAVNARDAMPTGGTLRLETRNVRRSEAPAEYVAEIPDQEFVCLTVSDTGVGMSEEVKKRLFEPFFTTKEVGKGTGLGLSTVFGIIRQGRGHVEVQSRMGLGTEFRVFLPVTEESVSLPAAKVAVPAPKGGGETILVVEDSEPLRLLIKNVLSLQKYRILAASNGVEALAVLKEASIPVHLILTDVIMPEMTGPELMMAAQKVRPGIRILFMSGYTDGEINRMGTLPVGFALIEKPFSNATLARKIREVLDA